MFQTFDRNRDGRLSRREFREAIESLKLGINTAEIEMLVQEADSSRDGNIDFTEFSEFVNPRGSIVIQFSRLIRYLRKTLKDLFDMFDKDRSGFISHSEFREACTRLNVGMTSAEIEELINFIDKSRDGRIDFNEFTRYMEATQEEEFKQPPVSP